MATKEIAGHAVYLLRVSEMHFKMPAATSHIIITQLLEKDHRSLVSCFAGTFLHVCRMRDTQLEST